MSPDKQCHGSIEATSKGAMRTANTDVKGSGAYVALEHVRGSSSTARADRFANRNIHYATRGTSNFVRNGYRSVERIENPASIPDGKRVRLYCT